MPSFMRRIRSRTKGDKGTRTAPTSSSTLDRTKRAPPAEKKIQKNQASPRGVIEDDFFISDVSSSEDGSSLKSDETTSSGEESSYDEETVFTDDAPKALVDMIKNAFSGSDDEDSLSNSNADDVGSAKKINTYSKQCYWLGLNDGNLVEMDIECSLIGKDIAKEMKDALPSNNRLQKLCIGCSSDKHHRLIFRIILSGLAGNSSVSELVVRGASQVKTQEGTNDEVFNFDREAASWLSPALAKHQSVQKICLKECRFIDSAIAILFMGMQHSRIKEISIISSNLSDFNADIVSASLPLMGLTSLSIVDASLTTNGLSFVCNNIKKTASLTRLNLCHNSLGRQGATLLAKSIKSSVHCKLTDLMLSCCSLDDVSMHHLVGSLKGLPSLSVIDLSQNELSDQGALYLKGLLEKNNAITDLRVDGNKITSRKRQAAIADGLRYNNSVLKTFGFSVTTSLAIFQTVDALEDLGGQIGATVSEAVNA
jgi:hypothetical protein